MFEAQKCWITLSAYEPTLRYIIQKKTKQTACVVLSFGEKSRVFHPWGSGKVTCGLIRQRARAALCSGFTSHIFQENHFSCCKSVNFTELHEEYETLPTFSLPEVIAVGRESIFQGFLYAHTLTHKHDHTLHAPWNLLFLFNNILLNLFF